MFSAIRQFIRALSPVYPSTVIDECESCRVPSCTSEMAETCNVRREAMAVDEAREQRSEA